MLPLRETRSLPSARRFAECRNTGTRLRGSLPSAALGKAGTRQRPSLSSVFFLAHGKNAECYFLAHGKIRLCRVFFFWHSAKMYFAECYFSAHGKIHLCRVPKQRHSAKYIFAECQNKSTRQNTSLPSARKRHSTKTHFAVC